MHDPLEEYYQRAKFRFESSAENSTDMFTELEKREYVNSLNELRMSIDENFKNLSSDVKEFIDVKFNYLEGRLEVLNKTDWIAVARQIIYDVGINVTANTIVIGATAAVQARLSPAFMELVVKAFKGVMLYLMQ
jgi:hypothetical protein